MTQMAQIGLAGRAKACSKYKRRKWGRGRAEEVGSECVGGTKDVAVGKGCGVIRAIQKSA